MRQGPEQLQRRRFYPGNFPRQEKVYQPPCRFQIRAAIRASFQALERQGIAAARGTRANPDGRVAKARQISMLNSLQLGLKP